MKENMLMKDIISITELAKLRNVSTETLRHYDRIGLFKPSYVDPNTGYRYYSILYQNERLGTIRELQQLGMSLKEIKDYCENRNVEKSLEILKQKREELEEKIVNLQNLYKVISDRIETAEIIKKRIHYETPLIQHIPPRIIISNGIECEDDVNLSFQVLKMERLLEGLAPTVATNRFGVIRKLQGNQFSEKLIPLIFQQFTKDEKETFFRDIPEGDFACLFYKGDIWTIERELDILDKYINENSLKYAGDLIQILQIDISISGSSTEMVIELQIPVNRS